MTAMPPSVPPTAGAMIELHSDANQSEMIESCLRPTEQQKGLVMEAPQLKRWEYEQPQSKECQSKKWFEWDTHPFH
jgi:hypothetical protein